MSFSIEGKTAVVTGAASGVGLAVARHFLNCGANVVFSDMNDQALKHECSAELKEKHKKTLVFMGDLRQKLTVANLISATVDAFDRIDILVNAARQVTRTDPLDPEDNSLNVMLDQNLTAGLRLSQAIARRMIKQGADRPEDEGLGSIINLSSIAAQRTHPDLMGFSIATAAKDQMTRSMAVALAPHRIRVNGVAFGSIMSNSLMDQLRKHEEYRDAIIKGTPLQRIAPARNICDTVQYLASDAANFVTGQIVTVDGGRTLIDPVDCPAH